MLIVDWESAKFQLFLNDTNVQSMLGPLSGLTLKDPGVSEISGRLGDQLESAPNGVVVCLDITFDHDHPL